MKINEEAVRKLQEDANRGAQDAIREVNAEMRGGDVDSIHNELIRRLRARKYQPNESEVRKYAQSISEGSLRD